MSTISNMMRAALVALLAGLALSGCGGLFFFPDKEIHLTPDQLRLAYEDVEFASRDGTRLHGWFLPAVGAPRGTIVYFHGNAENVSTHIAAIHWLPAAGYQVFIFDYRGYGRSLGKEDMHGVHLDGQAALDYVGQRADVDPAGIVVFGQSLGGAIAIYSAASSGVPVRAVVVESAFSSYRAIFREKLADFFLTWPLQWPLSLAVTDRYSPLTALERLKDVPVLVIHGDQDRIVPVQHARRLYAAAGKDRELWIIEGGAHIAAFTEFQADYRPRLRAYLARHLDAAAAP